MSSSQSLSNVVFSWVLDDLDDDEPDSTSSDTFVSDFFGVHAVWYLKLVKVTPFRYRLEVIANSKFVRDAKYLIFFCGVTCNNKLIVEEMMPGSLIVDDDADEDVIIWNFDRFIKKQRGKFKDNYVIVISIKVAATAAAETSNVPEEIEMKPKTLDDEMFHAGMTKLWKDRPYSDVSIFVENKEIPAHKCILSSRSQVFAAILETAMQGQNAKNEICIKNETFEVFLRFLEFIYTGRCEEIQKYCEQLYECGVEYQVDDLKLSSLETLGNEITEENITDRLVLAKKYQLPELRQMCFDFMRGTANNKENLEFSSKICRDMFKRDMLKIARDKHYPDIVFLVSGKEVPAHKAILSSRYLVFAAMFEHDMKESRDNVVEIEDINLEVFELFLEFVYSGDCEKMIEHCLGLFVCADKYCAEDLRMAALEALGTDISVENVPDRLMLAKRFQLTDLRNKCFQFIKRST